MKKNKVKTICNKALVKAAYKMASLDANTACPLIGYQPELPKAVKKLRKF